MPGVIWGGPDLWRNSITFLSHTESCMLPPLSSHILLAPYGVLVTRWFQPTALFTFIKLTLSLSVLGSPSFAWGEDTVNPAARHERLATAIAEELKSISPTRTNHPAYVHWLHLDRDDIVDALVIVKPDESSCAVIKPCTGLIIQGERQGFRVVSLFIPNGQTIYLGPRPADKALRTIYLAGKNGDYDEVAFQGGRYQISQKGISRGTAEGKAPWVVSENQFDNLKHQTNIARNAIKSPLGAPFDLRIEIPPTAQENLSALIPMGYGIAKAVELSLRTILSNLASRYLLSHSITVEFITCDDWVTRVPLKNQGAPSSGHVVLCEDFLALLHDRFLQGYEADVFPEALRSDSAKLEKARIDFLQPFGLYNLAPLSSESKQTAISFAAFGTVGQALALQQNIPARTVSEIDRHRSKNTETSVRARRFASLQPDYLSYLFGSFIVKRVLNMSFDQSSRVLFSRAASVVEFERTKLSSKRSAERDVFLQDAPIRFWAASCVTQKTDDVKKPLPSANSSTEGESFGFDPDWEACSLLMQILDMLYTE